MRFVAPAVLAIVNLLVLALAWRISRGATWMLSGYDASRVSDERALARWCGGGLALLGCAGLAFAGLLAVAPVRTSPIVMLYAICVAAGVTVISKGARRWQG
jgi:hypothetical protein